MERIFHAQNWELDAIYDALPEIKKQGFTAVLTSVLQGKKTNSKNWYWTYQPLDIAFVDSDLGTKYQYMKLCSKAHELGLKIFTDVVLRHIASDDHNKMKPNYQVNKRLLKYVKNVGDCYNYDDRNLYTTMATGMPMLDYDNPKFQQICKDFLHELVYYGCDGFRIDSCKHHRLPSEGSSFIHIFDEFKDLFIFGEVIFERKNILDEYAKYINVISDGCTSDPNKTVFFFESHDTYYPEAFGYTNRMDDKTRIREYAVLMNRENVLYFARPFEDLWKSDEIRRINLRQY